MDLLLHIGVPKTGTTSIQKWLSRVCSPSLGDIFVPDMSLLPGTSNGNHLGIALYSKANLIWGKKLEKNIRKLLPKSWQKIGVDEFLLRFSRSLENTVQTAEAFSCKTIFLSTEHLSSRLFGDEISCFSDNLDQFFDNKKVLVYLRRQSEAFMSLYGQTLKGGKNSLSIENWYENSMTARRVYDYDYLLRQWESRGWEIQPCVYYERDSAPPDWDLIRDLKAQVWFDECDLVSGLPILVSENKTSRMTNLRVQRWMNRLGLGSYLSQDKYWKTLSILSKLLGSSADEYQRNRSYVETLYSEYIQSNRKVALRYFEREELF